MIATGNNNISNIKIGDTQIKNIYLGTSGVWSNKMRIDYTVKNYLYFSGDVTQYANKLNGFNTTLIKSITWDTDNYITMNTIGGLSSTKTITYESGSTIVAQQNSFTDTIYKSDLNKYQYTYSSFTYTYKNTSGVDNYNYFSLNGYGYNNPAIIVTNGGLNNSVIMNYGNFNTKLTLDAIGVPKFTNVLLDTIPPQSNITYTIIGGVRCLRVVITTTLFNLVGVNFNANTKYKLNDGLLYISATGSSGLDWYTTSTYISLSHDDFQNVYTNDSQNNTITLTQYYEYTGEFIDDPELRNFSVKYQVKNDNLNGHVIISLDGTFTENEMVGCIFNANFYVNGTSKTTSSFTSYNTAPTSITATKYETIFEYTLTDIYD